MEHKPTELTELMTVALKRAVNSIRPFACFDHCPEKKILMEKWKTLIERIEVEKLDIRLSPRDY